MYPGCLSTAFILMVFHFTFAVFNLTNVYAATMTYLRTSQSNQTALERLLVSGSMNGYYTHDDFFDLITQLAKAYPQYLSLPVRIGKTFKKKAILAVQLGELSKLIREQSRKGECARDCIASCQRSNDTHSLISSANHKTA